MSIDKSKSSDGISLERRYQLLVESIKDYAIYMLSPEGIVNSWNAGAQHFKGYTAKEIVGQNFSRFFTPEDLAAGLPAHALQIALNQGQFESEGWRVRKDGSRFWAHVVIDPIHDESGKFIGFAKITRDVTTKKVAQDALRDSEARFRFLVNGVTDYAIYMLSPTGEITNWNAGAQRIKGYTEQEVIGTHFSRFYTEEDNLQKAPTRALETASREGKFEAEGWRVRKDGSRFWAHVVIDSVHDQHGDLLGFAKITRDVTQQRESAIKLEETRLALVQSQKMESIGKLTGGIAHDFNNLLQGIMGNLDLLRLRIALGQTAELGHHLDAAISGVKRSAALTHRLLAFARRQTLQAKPVDVNLLVQAIMDLLQRSVGPDIAIHVNAEEGLWWTHCDQNQLENALLNLVINARDAMPEGGRVSIHASNVLQQGTAANQPMSRIPPGDYVRLSISDTGSGMTPEVLKQACEPFFTTKPFGEGTGLGLSMVHGFITQSDGYVSIDSALGKGTTINLYLPKHVALSEALLLNEIQEAIPAVSKKRLEVLIVDDEEAVRTMLTEMLQQFGYAPLAATDGHDGLHLLEARPQLDLLITDIGLPGGMNGRQLANAARQIKPELKILLISGYADPAVIEKDPLPSGMQFLMKPFAMDTLLSMVQSMTDSEPGKKQEEPLDK